MKIFEEQQYFTQWYIWLLGHSINIGLVILFGYAIVTQIFFNKQFGNKPTSNTILILLFLLMISVTVFLFIIKLKTRIDEIGIHFKFFPFHFKFKTILWSEINKVYVRKYQPINEFGGWGIKGKFLWNKEKGIAYNVSGDIGIQLELKNNQRILIGTKKENNAKQVLTNYSNKIKTL